VAAKRITLEGAFLRNDVKVDVNFLPASKQICDIDSRSVNFIEIKVPPYLIRQKAGRRKLKVFSICSLKY